jgi:nucleoid-associated protein YgaU
VLPVDRIEQPLPDPQRVPDAVPPALPAPAGLAPKSSLPEAESAEAPPVDMPTTYVTVAKDSFWNISKLRYGGEGRYFKALYFHNRDRILRPDQIPAGIEIRTPPAAELLRLYPEHCQLGQLR